MSEDVDLTTAAGAEAWCLYLKKMATALFREHKAIANPLMILLAMRDPERAQPFDKPVEIVNFIDKALLAPTVIAKNRLAAWIRRMARSSDAIGFAYIAEVWVLSRSEPGDWGNVPDRREAIVVNVQHRALGEEARGYARQIERLPSGKALLDVWKLRTTRGRFSDVLRPQEEVASVATTLDSLRATGERLTPEQRRHHAERAAERLVKEEGLSRTNAERAVWQLVCRLRESGMEVASRPGDPAPNAKMERDGVGHLDINDWLNDMEKIGGLLE